LHVPLALGTQTGGSIIRPASFCGVFAMKPTWGIVSYEGAKSFAPSLDTIGWFGRSAADLALLYDVFDAERAPASTLTLPNLRIAVCRSPAWNHAEDATREALAEAETRLRAEGARIQEMNLPVGFERLVDLQNRIMRCEGRSTFLSEYRAHPSLLHENIRGQVENVDRFSREDLRMAYDAAAACRVTFDRLASEFDAVLTPSAAGEAPLGLDHTGTFVFNAIWTLLHAPCINFPGFTGSAGLPVGLTLVGPRFADRRVLAAAACMEQLFLH
jgi:Asp-tRNA(Asn)/Glu-tRNA(Gln) amidotransferase A subunit family amidase